MDFKVNKKENPCECLDVGIGIVAEDNGAGDD